MVNGLIKKWTIYKITNPVGQVYIGLTSNYKRRIARYKYKECTTQPLMFNSINLFGFSNHNIEVIEEFECDKDFAYGKEIFWIRTMMSNRNQWPEMNGLNDCKGGPGTLGRPQSEKNKAESSLRNKGYKHTQDAIRKIGEASKGNKYNLGRKHSEETKKRRSDALKRAQGRPVDQYSKDGAWIKTFDSIGSASNELGIPRHQISEYCRGKGNHNLIWNFKFNKDAIDPRNNRYAK